VAKAVTNPITTAKGMNTDINTAVFLIDIINPRFEKMSAKELFDEKKTYFWAMIKGTKYKDATPKTLGSIYFIIPYFFII